MAVLRKLVLFCMVFIAFLSKGLLETQGHPLFLSNTDGSMFKDDKVFNGVLSHIRKLGQSGNTFSVDDFGAKADGTDDTQAFLMAWKKACSTTGPSTFVVPNKSYLLRPIKFQGPCKSAITVQIKGTLEASKDRSGYPNRHWIVFEGVKNMEVQGGGTINGNGKVWWENSCKVNKKMPCKGAPTALTFEKCHDFVVRDLKVQDAQQMHVTFDDCVNVVASGLIVTAPGNSPNTDGIHVTHTKKIIIKDSVIGTGDDCISIESGTQNLQAIDVTCGPGHGISIGSLGDDDSNAVVSGITVNRAKLSGTKNGVRIKTYQGGSGSASNILFENIEMHNVENPIIIDQYYCDEKKPCKEEHSAVQVKNVMYKNIKGTSASDVAIKFECSKTYPCKGIEMEDVKIERAHEPAKAECSNIKLSALGDVSPQCP